MSSWDKYFIKMAMLVASKSKDPSTQVGCVIVGPDKEIRSTGFNGFPRGVAETVTVTPQAHFVKEREYDIATRDVQLLCTCGHVEPTPEIEFRAGNLPAHFTGIPSPEDWISELNERRDRPQKYDWVEHAERNAVYNAARMGTPLKGCIAYLNWEPHPCVNCTKAFIQAGISEVVGPDIPFPTNTDWKFDISRTMMDEAEVNYRAVSWDEKEDTT